MSGTQADGAQGAQGQDGQQGGGAPTDPRGWLPEEFRADKAFEPFKDIGALAKSYRDTVKFVGADKATLLRLPKDEAAPEWADVWTKLGRPEKPDGYTFEGIEDMPGLDGFRQAAHEAGLPTKAAQKLAGWYAQHQDQQREQMRASTEQALRQEWGAAYEERIHSAKKLVEQVGGKEMIDFVERSGFGNHPTVIKMLAKLAGQVAEPGALKGGGGGSQPGAGALSPAEAKAEWEQLQRDREFMGKYLSGNGPETERARRLFAQMHPGMTSVSS